MDLEELLGCPLRKRQKTDGVSHTAHGTVDVRALVLVVDCGEVAETGIRVSKHGTICGENVIFVCSQQKDRRDGVWRECLLDPRDNPVTNFSSKSSTKAFMQRAVQNIARGQKVVSADMYFHSGEKSVPECAAIEAVWKLVRRVAQLTGPACCVGAGITGTGDTSAQLLADLRVALVKGVVKMYSDASVNIC
jgi:hypothetical protein